MSLPNSSDEGLRFEQPQLPPPPPPPPPPVGLPAAEDEPTLDRRRRRHPPEPLPETSFADRYRGTEFDEQPSPAEPAEPPQPRRVPPRLLVGGGVALTVIGLVSAVALVMTSVPRTGLTGFNQMTPAPTASAAAGATAAPTGNLLLAPPTQAPWLTDPLHPAGLFKELLTAAGAAYRVDLAVTMDAGGQQARMTQTADVWGSDYTLIEVVTTVTQSIDVAAVRKSPYYYTKLSTQPWVRRAGPPTHGVLGNLDAVAWAGMQYVGPESVGDRLMHHLRVPLAGWPGAADTMIFDVVQAPPTYTLDVWVDDKGRPASARVLAQLTLRVGGRETLVSMDAEYTFSRWGKHPKIEAPTHFNPG